jgi:hypothetical protein
LIVYKFQNYLFAKKLFGNVRLTMSEGREMGGYREKLFAGWGLER